jgi:glucose-6-phosphate-specific signal transduction histidine kinase
MAWLRATVAGFSSGEVHTRRRALVEADLARLDPAALQRASASDPEGDVRQFVVRTVAECLRRAEPDAVAEAVTVVAGAIMQYDETEVEIEVSDDGAGTGPAGYGNRRGLAGLGERVAVLGGRWHAGPRPDGGWTLRATLPVLR